MRAVFLTTLLGLFIWHTPETQRAAQPDAPATDLNLAVQTGHTGMIRCLAFSPDGELLASGGNDQTVVLWKVVTGRQIRALKGHFGDVRSVGFSADGKRIASTGSGRDRSIKLWSVETGELLKTFAIEHDILSISFSHDGLYLAGFDDELGLIFLWDAVTGRELHPLLDHRASAIAFSPVEPLLASADKYSDTISLLDPRTAKVVRVLRGHEGRVYALQFSRDGKALVSGGEDGTVRQWVVGTGKPAGILKGYPNQIRAVSLTGGSGTALSLGDDGLVRAGDFKTGKVVGVNAAGFEAQMGTFSSGGETLATREELENVVLWDRAGGGVRRTLTGNGGQVTGISYNPSENSIATSDANGAVTIWSLKARGGPRLLTARNDPDRLAARAAGAALSDSRAVGKGGHQGSVAFNPGGDLVASAEGGGAIRVWDVNSGEELSTGACPTCYSFAFAAKGNVLALDPFPDVGDLFSRFSMSDGGHKLANPPVEVWDVSCKERPCLSKFRGLRASITSDMSLSGDGKTVAALGPSYNIPMVSFGFSPGTMSDVPFEYTWVKVSYPVRIFDVDTGRSLRTFSGQTFGLVTPDGVLAGRATSLAYSPRRNVLASGGGLFDKGHIDLWNSSTGEPLRTLQEPAEVNSLAFEPVDGTILASATDDPNITLWDVNSYAPAGVLKGHSDAVLSVVFSSDGRFLFSGSKDNTVKVWDVKGRKELATMTVLGGNNWMVVTPDGLFDTSSLEANRSASWVMRDDPLNPLPIEIFMRDYYQPNLLPRIFRGEELPKLPSPVELNRVQPKVGGVKVLRREGDAEFVDVSVEVSSMPGQCMRAGQRVRCESGVYDLRLYRDGHLVARSPAPDPDAPAGVSATQGRQAQAQEWRRSSVVKTEDGRAVTAASGKQTITFKGIRLPLRAEVPGVEFTAYAFNEDRVKSTTSEPAVYPLSGTRSGGRPRAYVVAVGVDVTSDPNWRLSFAPNGARDVARLLEEKLAPKYEVVIVPLISEYSDNDAASDPHPAAKQDIHTVLNLLSSRGGSEQQQREFPALVPATPDDLVVMYVASHGYADPSGKFYVIPSDIGEAAGVSEELLDRCLRNSEQSGSCEAAREFLRRSISSDELTQWLQGVDAGQMVLILDSCHSGAVSGPDFKPGPMGDRGFGQLSYDKGMVVLAATQAENVAWGTLELEDRSLLTYALTKQQTPAQPLDFRQWLSRAEKLVPDLYRRNLNEKQQQQEPMLFDFARKRVAGAGDAP